MLCSSCDKTLSWVDSAISERTVKRGDNTLVCISLFHFNHACGLSSQKGRADSQKDGQQVNQTDGKVTLIGTAVDGAEATVSDKTVVSRALLFTYPQSASTL